MTDQNKDNWPQKGGFFSCDRKRKTAHFSLPQKGTLDISATPSGVRVELRTFGIYDGISEPPEIVESSGNNPDQTLVDLGRAALKKCHIAHNNGTKHKAPKNTRTARAAPSSPSPPKQGR